MSGPLPEEVRTLRLLELGVSLSEIDAAPAVRLDELLALDAIRREVSDAGMAGPVDRERQRS